MGTMKAVLLALAGVVTLLVAAACGGDDADEGGAADGDSTEATTTTASATATAGGNLEDLRALLLKADGVAFSVTYDFVSSSFGGLDGVLVLSADPPARALDFEGATPIGEGRFVLIDDGAESYLCIAQGGEESCAEGAAAGDIALLAGLSVTEIIDDVVLDEETVAREVEGRAVAAREARCFEVSGSVSDGVVCAGEDGVPLFLEGDFNGVNVRLEATARGEAEAGAFEPPFAVE
jgi:hypothetical protein